MTPYNNTIIAKPGFKSLPQIVSHIFSIFIWRRCSSVVCNVSVGNEVRACGNFINLKICWLTRPSCMFVLVDIGIGVRALLKKSFVGTPQIFRSRSKFDLLLQIERNHYSNRPTSKNTFSLFWSIEQEKISKPYFNVYNDYECGKHKISLELYETVEWARYTLWFHTLNHYIR